MRDPVIFAALKPILADGFVASAMMGVHLERGFPAANVGAEDGPALYIAKVSDRPLGHPRRVERLDVDDPQGPVFIHEMRQWMESTFQATAVLRQEASGITASDVANEGRAILQLDETIDRLREAGLAILRVVEVRNPPEQNERGQFEFFPNFDFVLEHEQVTMRRVPVVTGTEVKIIPV